VDHRHRAVPAGPRRPVPGRIPPVVVVGAGIVGAACALALHDRGIDVLLLDRGTVSSGTTGLGEGNVLLADKTPEELPLARAGRAVWDDLAARFPGAVRIRRKGALVLFEDETAPAFAARLGPDAEVVADPQAVEPALAPGLPPAVLVPGDSQVDPRGTARAMAAEVPVREHATVAALDPHGVTLDSGERIAADAVALCAGPWSAALARELDVRPRKGQLVALGPAPRLVVHKCFEASYLALSGIAAVVEEALSGEVYAGSSRADVGFDTTVDPAVTQALHDRAARWFPALAGLPRTRAWAGLRPYRPGGIFCGRLDSGVYACTGHEGSGVGLGPVTGRRLAQFIERAS
jgi:glycine/D-amino acid oxidase-like deaminating enzyme